MTTAIATVDPSQYTTAGDDHLMAAVSAGDGLPFETLYERYWEELYGFIFARCHDRHLAEDLAQQVMLRVFRASSTYRPKGQFRSWLFSIARNILIDNSRRQSCNPLANSVRCTATDCVFSSLEADSDSPWESLDQQEFRTAVEELVDDLPDEQRQVFELYHFEELSLPEIAEIMHANKSTTKSRLRLANERIREGLSESFR